MTHPLFSRARLFAAAILVLPLATEAKEAMLVLDRSQSHIEIAVKATVDSFVARVEDFDVAVAVDPESGRVGYTTFHANLTAVKTGGTERDYDMGVWLQMSEFPQDSFELAALDRGPDGVFLARGRLKLHGQQHDVNFPVRITADRGLITIDGAALLDTRQYGLPIIRMLWVLTVDPVVRVHFRLQGRLAR